MLQSPPRVADKSVMLAIYICGGFALVLIIWIVYTHNVVVRARTKVLEAYSGIDVQLKLRRDLVPNLVRAVGGYAQHERTTLSLVTQARSRAVASQTPEQMDVAEQRLAGYLRGLLVLAEGYPELRASQNFIALMSELAEIENEIQASRSLYNQNVRVLNSYTQSFPASLVASRMRDAEFPFLGFAGVGDDVARLLGEGFAA